MCLNGELSHQLSKPMGEEFIRKDKKRNRENDVAEGRRGVGYLCVEFCYIV